MRPSDRDTPINNGNTGVSFAHGVTPLMKPPV